MTTIPELLAPLGVTTLEAVKNRKNGKLFIIVDDTLEARYKLVNPAGEVIILPDILFEEDPLSVPAAAAEREFTPEQISTYADFQTKAQEQARIEAARPKEPPRRVIEAEPAPAKRAARKVPSKSSATFAPRGLVAQWASPYLTFYKNRIEPLGDKQSFRVTVEGVGTFEMTKGDFMTHFNDVVMSPSYRSEGLFRYGELPEKANRFRK